MEKYLNAVVEVFVTTLTSRYVDDCVNSQKELQQVMDNLNKVNVEFDMKINVKKMKIMYIRRKGNNKLKIYVEKQQVEQMSQLRYLGISISEDEYCTKVIRSRIEMAKKVFIEEKMFTGNNESGTKEEKRITNSLVSNVAL